MTLWISRCKAVEVSIIGVGPKERPRIGGSFLTVPCSRYVRYKVDNNNNNDQSESKGIISIEV